MPVVTQTPVQLIPVTGISVRDDQNGSHYFGPFQLGANLYVVLAEFGAAQLRVYKSTDGGATWNSKDSVHSPFNILLQLDMILVGTVFQIVYLSNTNTLKLISFDTGTDTFGAISTGPANANYPRLAQWANGDLAVAYLDTSLPGPSVVVVAGGVWGAPASFVGNNTLTDLVIGADDIARLFYFNTGAPGLNVFFRTVTKPGVVSAQQAVFSSSYRANSGIDIFAEFPVGRAVIWNGDLILPYYGNPTGSGKQAGVYVGHPYTAPVWTFTLVDTLVWAGTEKDAYGYLFIDSSNNLYLFWCAIDSTNNISRIYYAVNPGAGFGAPIFYYDQVANPPADVNIGQPVHTLAAQLLANNSIGAFTAMNNTVTNACVGFYLNGAVGPPPPPPLPPSPPTYWNPGAAESLLCERQYPWVIPPGDRIPVRVSGTVAAPAVNVLTELWNYTVPDGFWFVFDRLVFVADVAGFVPGSGSIIFTLDVNTPITAPSPLPVGRPLAKFTSPVGELAEPFPVAPVQLYQGDILRAKALVTDNTLGVGLPNVITGIVEGWLFPHSRNI